MDHCQSHLGMRTETLHGSCWLLSRCVWRKSGEPSKSYKHALWMNNLTLNSREVWFRFWFEWNPLPKPSNVAQSCCTCRTGSNSRVPEI